MTFENMKSVVATTAGLTKDQAGQAITALIEHLQATLGEGDKVSLPGHGQFEVAERAARQGRNPRTGEVITIAASRAVKFKPSKALKETING